MVTIHIKVVNGYAENNVYLLFNAFDNGAEILSIFAIKKKQERNIFKRGIGVGKTVMVP